MIDLVDLTEPVSIMVTETTVILDEDHPWYLTGDYFINDLPDRESITFVCIEHENILDCSEL